MKRGEGRRILSVMGTPLQGFGTVLSGVLRRRRLTFSERLLGPLLGCLHVALTQLPCELGAVLQTRK